jgi:hypothetical protein
MCEKWILAHICYAFNFAPKPGVTLRPFSAATKGGGTHVHGGELVGDERCGHSGGPRATWMAREGQGSLGNTNAGIKSG